jgi:hypothetical protein
MASPARVFVSYSHDSPRHEELVLDLANRLREDGVDAEIDRYEDAPSEGWALWMQRQIEGVDFVICVCTETYKRRMAGEEAPGAGLGVRWEGGGIRQAIYDAGATNEKFIPVLLPGATTTDIPLELRPTTYYRVTDEQEYLRLYRRLTSQPEIERPPLGRAQVLPPRTVSPARRFFVPFARNPYFVGRHDILSAIATPLGVRSGHALVGMGGIGKSQLALEYAFTVRFQRAPILWTSAVSSSVIESGFARFARDLGLVGAETRPERAVEAMEAWFVANQDWLLIFDNAEVAADMNRWLPPRDAVGQVLLTSRVPNLGAIAGVLDVPLSPLTPGETAEYLARRLGRRLSRELEAGAHRLHAEIGGLPLALAQAAAYLGEVNMPVNVYISELQQNRLSVLGRGRAGPDYSETVATTFRVSRAKLREQSLVAADVLTLTVGLAPEPIPVELLVGGRVELGPAVAAGLEGAEDDPMKVWNALSPLRELSLAAVDPDLETISVHRLVTDAVRGELTEAELKDWARRAVRALNESFPVANYLNWPLCDRFLPHARAGAGAAALYDFTWDDCGPLLNEAASYLRMRGDYDAAERLHLQGIEVAERYWGAGDRHLASNYNNISFVYGDQFQFKRAIEWIAKASVALGDTAKWDDSALFAANLADYCCTQARSRRRRMQSRVRGI